MRRREFLQTAATGLTAAAAFSVVRTANAGDDLLTSKPIINDMPLTPPKTGKINVAFAIADHATVIDFAGPWEVFQDVHVRDRGSSHDEQMPFRLYTVAATADPITATAGLRIIPNFSVKNAPKPDLVVVPALRGNPILHSWLADVAPETDLTMSVCTGAFQLGKAGLLDGLIATTHHDFYDAFEEQFPDVQLERGVRFVENKRIASAGGLTSGIDLALRTVERYFGRETAQHTADYMEYMGTHWKV